MKRPSITVFTLTLINIATILSIRNWPCMAEYGFSSLFFLLVAAAVFFIPVSLVSAELASAWPEKGGIFVWVKEALGKRAAFFAVLLLWISNVVWYPTILSFFASTLAYAFNPALVNNAGYNFCVILATFWGVLLVNGRGIKISERLNSVAVILGTIVPGLLIILFGLSWFLSGNPCEITCNFQTFLPSLGRFEELVFLAGMLLGLAGMELNAVHAKDVENPRKNYPKAIFFSAIVILLFSVLGTFSIGVVIPKEKISLVSASLESLKIYLNHHGWGFALPAIALLVAFGAFGGMSVWISGTNQGLIAALEETGAYPALLAQSKKGAPVRMLVLQGAIVSCLSLTLLIMPTLSSSFWILTALASQFYTVVYILLFLSCILLRIRKSEVPRIYQVPGGKPGFFLINFLGLAGCLFTLAISFFPPSQIQTGSALFYGAFFLFGWALVGLVPLTSFKKQEAA